jgi:cell wall-associated NlpC family hydrolase
MKKKLVCLTLACIISASQIVSVGATREDELRQEQAQTSEQLDATYSAINSLEEQKQAIADEIDVLDQDLVDVMVQINVLKKDINNKEDSIDETKKDLKKAKRKEKKQYEAMKKRIQYLYENGGNTAWFQMILNAEDIADLLNKAEYAQKMYTYDREKLEDYQDTVTQVKSLKTQLEGEMAELVDMQEEEEKKQDSLEAQLEEKRENSADCEEQIAAAQAQAEAYASLLQQQTEEIAVLEAERLAAEEEARRQAEAEAAAAAAAQEEAENTASSEDETDQSQEDTEDTYEDDTDYSQGDTEDSGDSYSQEDSQEESTEDTTESSSQGSSMGQVIANYALQFVGNPYVYGGTSLTNGADCSGFVQSVYAHFGYSLSRTSESQMYEGVSVSYADAQPGDLICYGSHIAIYLGNGQIVHASNSAPYPAGGIKVSDNAAYRTILAVRRIV